MVPHTAPAQFQSSCSILDFPLWGQTLNTHLFFGFSDLFEMLLDLQLFPDTKHTISTLSHLYLVNVISINLPLQSLKWPGEPFTVLVAYLILIWSVQFREPIGPHIR